MTLLLATGVFLAVCAAVWSIVTIMAEVGQRSLDDAQHRLEQRLRQLFVFTNAKRLIVAFVLGVALCGIVLWILTKSLILLLLVPVMAVWLPRFWMKRLEARRQQRIANDLPDVLDQLAASMFSGSTLPNAMQVVSEENAGPVGQEFTLLLREHRLGTSLEEALDNMGDRVKSEDMDLVITAALISREVGGNLAETLRRLAETLRRKIETEGKIRSLTAQGVLQGRVVCLLPFAVLLALWFLEPDTVRPMFHSLFGWIVLSVIVILELAGNRMIQKIINIDI